MFNSSIVREEAMDVQITDPVSLNLAGFVCESRYVEIVCDNRGDGVDFESFEPDATSTPWKRANLQNPPSTISNKRKRISNSITGDKENQHKTKMLRVSVDKRHQNEKKVNISEFFLNLRFIPWCLLSALCVLQKERSTCSNLQPSYS